MNCLIIKTVCHRILFVWMITFGLCTLDYGQCISFYTEPYPNIRSERKKNNKGRRS